MVVRFALAGLGLLARRRRRERLVEFVAGRLTPRDDAGGRAGLTIPRPAQPPRQALFPRTLPRGDSAGDAERRRNELRMQRPPCLAGQERTSWQTATSAPEQPPRISLSRGGAVEGRCDVAIETTWGGVHECLGRTRLGPRRPSQTAVRLA